jgi:hypothetical protein
MLHAFRLMIIITFCIRILCIFLKKICDTSWGQTSRRIFTFCKAEGAPVAKKTSSRVIKLVLFVELSFSLQHLTDLKENSERKTLHSKVFFINHLYGL